MEIISFTSDRGRKIGQYGSTGASITLIIRKNDCLSVVCIHIEARGRLGAHPAVADQLFLVAAGEGSVSSGDQDETLIRPGSAVLWRKGELHQTRAGSSGLLALVIEGEGLAASLNSGNFVYPQLS